MVKPPGILAAPVSAWIAAAMLLAASRESTAAELVVRMYDNFGVAREEMAIAQAAAGAILKEAGVDLTWRDCATGCEEALGPREVIVRIGAAPKAAAPGSLGCAVIDLQQGSGTLATMYADRIMAASERTGMIVGELLGRTVAHEIGHLLLGTSRHSAAGLMRALWSDRELQRNHAADWTWSSDDLRRLGAERAVSVKAAVRVPF